ncbi:hypothetical protein Q5P01_003081 [Channa striata]|uniref:Uncharacterized protein n=1 Tax=Channa striata TaxID=64152 RepID=A0AA88NUC5_CHASR|nr:hypothetical protein Q5P01_003081 [Channa striata]
MSEFKSDVKNALRDDLAKFKDEVLLELQNPNANITEAQTRIAELESACMEVKDMLVTVAKQSMEMQNNHLENRPFVPWTPADLLTYQ